MLVEQPSPLAKLQSLCAATTEPLCQLESLYAAVKILHGATKTQLAGPSHLLDGFGAG